MTTARRILIPGALIAVPVAFALGSVALAQMPPSPHLPEEPLTVRLAEPSATPAPAPVSPVTPVVPAPVPPPPPAAPAPPPAPAPPAPAPPADDDDDDGGDDD